MTALVLAIGAVYALRIAQAYSPALRWRETGDKVLLNLGLAVLGGIVVYTVDGVEGGGALLWRMATQLALQQLVHDLTHQPLPRNRAR